MKRWRWKAGSRPRSNCRCIVSASRAETGKAAPRRFALAASVVLALLVGGGAWLFRPQSALAGEVVEHVMHEPGSWQQQEPVPPETLAAVLAKAGVRYDARFPVTYALALPVPRAHRAAPGGADRPTAR